LIFDVTQFASLIGTGIENNTRKACLVDGNAFVSPVKKLLFNPLD
jgi:hypothetical protein